VSVVGGCDTVMCHVCAILMTGDDKKIYHILNSKTLLSVLIVSDVFYFIT